VSSPSPGDGEAPPPPASAETLASIKPAVPSLARRFAPLLLALVATLTFLTIPRYPYIIDDALSWNAVLNFAHQHDLQFGQDIVFTYGPLGFLVSRYYFPEVAGLRTVADLLLCFSAAASVFLIGQKLRKGWKWLFVGIFILTSANIDPRADLVLYVSLLCWGILCALEKSRRALVYSGIFVATAVFASLAKVTFIFVGILSVVAVGSALLAGAKKRRALALVLAYAGGMGLAWMLAGQELSNLGRFLAGAWAFTRGYDQSMGLEGLPALRGRGMLVVLCALAATTLRASASFRGGAQRPGWSSVVIASWIAALTLLVAKHGLVRADLYHAGFLFGFAPVAALIGEVLACPSPKTLLAARAFSVVCCVLSLLTLQSLFVSDLASLVLQPFRAIPLNLQTLLRPAEFRRQMQADLEAARGLTALPRTREQVGRATTDVFGHDQIYAILNELNFRPRPVFQSYLAYNAALGAMNEHFYSSATAPEFVLFNLTPIDRRFPPLEDSLVLRDLLINYEPVGAEKDFLLLKARTHELPRLTLLREGTVQFGQPIDLREFAQANLWMQIEAEPTLPGRLRELLYKPSRLRIKVVAINNASFVAPAPMLSAGFLASPLVLRREAFSKLYAGENGSRPQAYSIEPAAGGERFWKPTVGFRIYRIENGMGQRER